MGLLNLLKTVANLFPDSSPDHTMNGAINYGGQTSTGGHDHRTNKGEDRTPAQKAGDKSRRKET